jgi:hypothetical protein
MTPYEHFLESIAEIGGSHVYELSSETGFVPLAKSPLAPLPPPVVFNTSQSNTIGKSALRKSQGSSSHQSQNLSSKTSGDLDRDRGHKSRGVGPYEQYTQPRLNVQEISPSPVLLAGSSTIKEGTDGFVADVSDSDSELRVFFENQNGPVNERREETTCKTNFHTPHLVPRDLDEERILNPTKYFNALDDCKTKI